MAARPRLFLSTLLTVAQLTITLSGLCSSGTAKAAAADPDNLFSADGIVVHAQNPLGDSRILVFNGVTIQSDGKIIAVGEASASNGSSFNSFIARFETDGDLDPTFNAGDTVPGWLELDMAGLRDSAFEVLVQQDGKILIGGHTVSNEGSPGNGNIFVVRLNSDGSLDTSFGASGGRLVAFNNAEDQLLGMALRADGRIVLTGSSNTNGAISSLFIQLTSAGQLDATFGGGDGIVLHALAAGNDSPSGLDLTMDGKLVFTGSSNNGGSSADANTIVGRLNADGTLDTTFASIGYRVINNLNASLRDFGDELLVLPDGSLLLAITLDTTNANEASLGVLKLDSNGNTDASFGDTGLRLIPPQGGELNSIFNATELSRQADGKILVLGAEAVMEDASSGSFDVDTARAVIARLDADGSLDTTFDGDDGIVRQTFGITAVYPRAAALQGEGKLVMAGRGRVLNGTNYTSYTVARLSTDTDTLDTTPDAISFTDVTAVDPGSEQISNVAAVSGLSADVLVPVLVSNGEYSFDGSTYLSNPGWAQNGSQIRVRHTASGLGNTDTVTTLTVGGAASQFNGSTVLGMAVTATFTSTTMDVDTVPAAFDFTDQDDVPLDTWIVSNTITVSDITFATPISISNGEYSIGCTATFTATAGTVSNGDTVCIRQRSAAAVSTGKTTTLTIGTVSDDFTTTTVDTVDSTPEAFSFTDQTGVTRLATVTSNSITVTGTTVPVVISISGAGGYSIGCTDTFVNSAAMISPGETVCLRHLAATAYSTDVTTTLTIGGVADTFTSTTEAAPSGGGGGGGGGGGSSPLWLSVLLLFAAGGRHRRELAVRQ